MPITLEQAKQNCRAARAAIERARAGGYALGAFNLDNQETLIAVVRAAAKTKAPVMVELSQGEVELLGLENIRDMVDNYKHEYGIEMYINLDHSPSVEAAKAAIDMGYEFIHIDISQADHDATEEAIIEKTREVVEYAERTGALVESEPHYFGGGSNKFTKAFDYKEIQKTFSTPEGAKAFVEATGIDTFAAAVGNLHGSYPVPKRLDLKLLEQLRAAIPCNISLHGGSGTPLHYFEDAVEIGVTKININSDMRIAYRTTLEQQLRENKSEFAVIKLMDAVIDEVQKVVESKIKAFNAVGKAVL